MNKISYCISVCNERSEIELLINQLNKYIRSVDEIVVLFDEKNGSDEVREYLETIENITFIRANFNNNFAEFKNKFANYASGDYIFQIDADELPHYLLLIYLPNILDTNPDVELFWVPRINTLNGASDKEIKQYIDLQKWDINDKGWINWPGDYQGRIYKNIPSIKWEGNVHERINGAKMTSILPSEEYMSLYHPKALQRQIKQNELYSKIN